MKRELYPKNWEEISLKIRERANGQCECVGECGLHDGADLIDSYNGRCREVNHAKAKYAKGKIVLTAAHLCQVKKCDKYNHLKAMCNRCHLRYDLFCYGSKSQKNYEKLMKEHLNKIFY